MALEVNTQDVDDTATEIGTSRGRRQALVVRNPTGSGATIFVGDADVDEAHALFVLDEGDPALVIGSERGNTLAGEEWYFVTATGSADGVVVGEV